MFLRRLADESLRAALARQAAVALIGPRQVGKTTLTRQIGAERDALYLDLESPEDRGKLANPRALFGALRGPAGHPRRDPSVGAETDLLLERPDGALWAIKVIRAGLNQANGLWYGARRD